MKIPAGLAFEPGMDCALPGGMFRLRDEIFINALAERY